MDKFKYGQIVVTKAVNDRMIKDSRFSNFCYFYLVRHLSGDWGDLDEEDQQANEEALKNGDRLFSSYLYKKPDDKLWIITEADRSATTLLFPEDY